MIESLLILTGGLVLLAVGAERIVTSSDAMARRLGFSPFFYALTVIALATSLPELVVNSVHAVRGNFSLVLDDVYGSIVFNVLAVLGLSAILRPLAVDRESVQRIAPMLLLTIGAVLAVIWNVQISRLDGVFLLAWLVPLAVVLRVKQTQGELAVPDPRQSPRRALLKLTSGLVALLAGSALLVFGIDSLADSSDLFVDSDSRIMGLLVVGISTSLPEVVVMIIGTIRKRGQLVYGTLVGSCSVNLVVGLGAPAVVADGILVSCDRWADFLAIDFPFLMLVSFFVLPLALMKRPFDGIIGVLYVLGYLAFSAAAVFTGSSVSFGVFTGSSVSYALFLLMVVCALLVAALAPKRFRRFPELWTGLELRSVKTPTGKQFSGLTLWSVAWIAVALVFMGLTFLRRFPPPC